MDSDSSTSSCSFNLDEAVNRISNCVFETGSSEPEMDEGRLVPEQSPDGNSSSDVVYDPFDEGTHPTTNSDSSNNPNEEPSDSTSSRSTVSSLTLSEYLADSLVDDCIQDTFRGEHHKFIFSQHFDPCLICRLLRRSNYTHYMCRTCRVHVCSKGHLQILHHQRGNRDLQSPPIASRTRFQRQRQNRASPVRGYTTDEDQGSIDLDDYLRRGHLRPRGYDSSSTSSESEPITRRRRLDEPGPSNAPQYRPRQDRRGLIRRREDGSSSGSDSGQRLDAPGPSNAPQYSPRQDRRGLIRRREDGSSSGSDSGQRTRRQRLDE